ncbi:DoxX family protein [Rugosimonospora africana]|uniref:DoxX-like family protein n=1 Tax=Rugosimonospora africana TaxID=556532 RepID=A0A8J3R013_9ACTN|nr:DoxX family protein [Rugosimonospora africana]GIH19043.1 hypothetical protein Raf01_72150 [Rugosimonospora africana]
MDIFLWVVQAVLCLAFLAAGGTKVASPKEKLATTMGWSKSWPPAGLKALGAVEVLGAIGVVLPWATGVATVLTPLAAVGLAVTMVGALVVHARRREYPNAAPTILLLILSVVVAVGRF